jgi:hypothetical protein
MLSFSLKPDHYLSYPKRRLWYPAYTLATKEHSCLNYDADSYRSLFGGGFLEADPEEQQ